MKKRGLRLLLAVISLAALQAQAKTFCSITINSSNETEAFEKKLSAEGFDRVELIPDSKNPFWFRQACDSGLQCDILLISGHFGGLFFGEGNSATFGISEMEEASCNNSCPGILKTPKEVYLMGCNTLATQAKDHRTVTQYLNVLISDGIPLDFAEQVAASRYSQQGFSLEKRFSAVFNDSAKIYGFTSTSPLGASAAARLKPYLSEVGSYSKHLDKLTSAPNLLLQSKFQGSSFRETRPREILDVDSRNQFCGLRSKDANAKAQALLQVVEENKVILFFDSLASQIKGASEGFANLFGRENLQDSLRQNLNKIAVNNKGLITIQYDVVKVSYGLDLISETEKLQRVQDLLDQAYAQELNYPKISQICGILKQEPRLPNSSAHRLVELSKRSPFFLLTLGCLQNIDRVTKDFLLSKILNPTTESERTLALSFMKAHWTSEDMNWVLSAIETKNATLKTRLYISARKLLKPYANSILPTAGLGACVLESEMKGGQSLGTNWGCLTEHNDELTIDVCDHFADLNPDPENADDMRWYCWSKTKPRLLRERSECYQLASLMKIQGNQMKSVWNCSNR